VPKELTRSIFKCVHCDREFIDEKSAKHHELNEHDIIYLPVERKDLNGLLNFLVTNDKNQELLTERLLKTIYLYTRA
jgi:hypothetical protein